MELHIERVDGAPPSPISLSEAQLIDRLDRAGRFLRFVIDDWSVKLTSAILDKAGYNTIYRDSFQADQAAANNPAAIYPTAMWKIEPGEALILESELPDAQYWSVQLGDMWVARAGLHLSPDQPERTSGRARQRRPLPCGRGA